MPTGYTADVADGKVTDLLTFALQCGRAFGACIEQRDESGNAPPRRREVSDYHAKALKEAKNRLVALKHVGAATADREAAAAFAERTKESARYEAQRLEKKARYEAMIAKVSAWTPPTKDHNEMKQFMLNQLQESIRFDCSGLGLSAPERMNGKEWLAKAIASAQRDVEYHEKEYAREVKSVEEANQWIDALYRSL